MLSWTYVRGDKGDDWSTNTVLIKLPLAPQCPILEILLQLSTVHRTRGEQYHAEDLSEPNQTSSLTPRIRAHRLIA